jgi:hypothetical protein
VQKLPKFQPIPRDSMFGDGRNKSRSLTATIGNNPLLTEQPGRPGKRLSLTISHLFFLVCSLKSPRWALELAGQSVALLSRLARGIGKLTALVNGIFVVLFIAISSSFPR